MKHGIVDDPIIPLKPSIDTLFQVGATRNPMFSAITKRLQEALISGNGPKGIAMEVTGHFA